MILSPDIQIKVDPRLASSSPMLVHVTMVADMAIYNANNGILDKAMEVVMVRRDAPGILKIAKLDPHAIMQPDIPLPPPVPGKEPSGFIKEERILDILAYGGAGAQGAADYFVVGVFAGSLSDPHQTSIDDTYRRPPAVDVKIAPPSAADTGKSLLSAIPDHGIVSQPKERPVAGVEGAFLIRQPTGILAGEKPPTAFVTIVAARRDPHGGVSCGTFLVDTTDDQLNRTGHFFIPFKMLTPEPPPGRYRILVFAGDYQAASFEMEVE
jgi:hypothetical protein